MNSAFHVPAGSIGEFQAIVKQFTKIVKAMKGSNVHDSMMLIASERGKSEGRNR